MQITDSKTKTHGARHRRKGSAPTKIQHPPAWRPEASGLTQAELAEHVGLRYYTFVSQVESGLGRLPIETQASWATALGLDPSDFAKTLLRYYEPELYRLLFGGEAAQSRATA